MSYIFDSFGGISEVTRNGREQFRVDLPLENDGVQTDYVDSGWEARELVIQAHEDHTAGFAMPRDLGVEDFG